MFGKTKERIGVLEDAVTLLKEQNRNLRNDLHRKSLELDEVISSNYSTLRESIESVASDVRLLAAALNYKFENIEPARVVKSINTKKAS